MLTVENISSLAGSMVLRKYDSGEKIYICGGLTQKILLIEKGALVIDLSNTLIENLESFRDPIFLDRTLGILRFKIEETDNESNVSLPSFYKSGAEEMIDSAAILEKDPWLQRIWDDSYIFDSETGRPLSCTLSAGCILGEPVIKGRIFVKGGWTWGKAQSKQGEMNSNGKLKMGCVSPYTVTAASVNETDKVHVAYFTIDIFERLFGNIDRVVQGDFSEMEPVHDEGHVHDKVFETKGFHDLYMLAKVDMGVVCLAGYTDVIHRGDAKGREKYKRDHSTTKFQGIHNLI